MRKVGVIIATAHDESDNEGATRSVMDALQRAGYVIEDVAVANQDNEAFEATVFAHGFVQAREPEVEAGA